MLKKLETKPMLKYNIQTLKRHLAEEIFDCPIEASTDMFKFYEFPSIAKPQQFQEIVKAQI